MAWVAENRAIRRAARAYSQRSGGGRERTVDVCRATPKDGVLRGRSMRLELRNPK